MPRRYLRQMIDGDTFEEIFLATEKLVKTNRQGQPFLQLELRDRSGSLVGRLWNAPESLTRQIQSGDFVRAKGKVQTFQGALQIILSDVQPLQGEKFDMTDFLPHTEQDIAKLQEKLKSTLFKSTDLHLRALAQAFFMDEKLIREFCKAPAGIRQHHAYLGGLLEHVVTMMDAAERLLPIYPDLHRDLVLMGIFLHDIGKVRELHYDTAFSYTDEGELIGHIILGVELLNEKIQQAEALSEESMPSELKNRLKHIIAAHHGQLEYGSPKLPMTPE
ncbi:MAG TPA: OB-fold nucleic acid binding domain-containing protein, partial [Gemmatales bacterium]|nr:OB-fold nucleic acid binding domain-containing protein [Gemmatales bacterium]